MKIKRATISVIAFITMYIVFLNAFMSVAIQNDVKDKKMRKNAPIEFNVKL